MESDFMEFDASKEWGSGGFGRTDSFQADLEDMLRAGTSLMAEAVQGLVQGARSLGLPPGATIEIEVSLRRRQHSF